VFLNAINPIAKDYQVIDKDTNTPIDFCVWADDVSGEYAIYHVINGEIQLTPDNRTFLVERKKGNIAIVRKEC
jgi:hypothetical protein